MTVFCNIKLHHILEFVLILLLSTFDNSLSFDSNNVAFDGLFLAEKYFRHARICSHGSQNNSKAHQWSAQTLPHQVQHFSLGSQLLPNRQRNAKRCQNELLPIVLKAAALVDRMYQIISYVR